MKKRTAKRARNNKSYAPFTVLNAKKHKYSGRIETNIENFFVTKSFLCNFAT